MPRLKLWQWRVVVPIEKHSKSCLAKFCCMNTSPLVTYNFGSVKVTIICLISDIDWVIVSVFRALGSCNVEHGSQHRTNYLKKVRPNRSYRIFSRKEFKCIFVPGNEMITPKFVHTTLKLTEEGEVNASVNGILSINILNRSKIFPLKVNLSYAIV